MLSVKSLKIPCMLVSFLIAPSAVFSQDYFQQEVNYSISVKLDDKLHRLSAQETIQYINKSPDTLGILYFHLWPNAYSGNNTALAKQLLRTNGKQRLFDSYRARGFIDSLDFKIDNQKISWNQLKDNPDICVLYPDYPLLPGDTISITTPFRVKIPEGNISRMGYSEGAYQVSQWYPKPAVYDRNGWHQMPYLDQGEFYSEFGNFSVDITLPENFLVAATGDLRTESESARIERLSSGDYSGQWADESNAQKTIEYNAENVHDFAWVAGRNFLVSTGKASMPFTGREIKITVMYAPRQAFIWNNAMEYVQRSLMAFSSWIGEYPYNSFVAVQSAIAAGSGMEYPGMAIIGDEEDSYSLDEVIAHEICHSWFYGALGSDERRYPFIDEGLSSAYEERYMELFYPGKKLWEVYFRNRKMARFFHVTELPVTLMPELQWLAQARNNVEQPADLPAYKYTERNYSDIIYYKTPKGFNFLRIYLGDLKFDSIIHAFYKDWSGKHPSPGDLRCAFESGSGKDLSWFFDDYLGTVKRADYSVKKIRGDSLLVKNKGELNTPLPLYELKDKKVTSVEWYEGFFGEKWLPVRKPGAGELVINYNHILPEINHMNNNIRTSGLFRRYDPLKIRLFMSLENPSENSFMLTPLVNWTRIDGFMLGAGFNNGMLLPKKVGIFAVPFFTFRQPGIAGKARLEYSLTPYNSIVRKATISLEGARFGSPLSRYYHVLATGIDVHLRRSDPLSFIDHMVYGKITMAKKFTLTEPLSGKDNDIFTQVGYTLSRGGLLNPYRFSSLLESNGDYQKASVEFRYRLSYNGRNRGLDARLFGGLVYSEDTLRRYYSLAPSGRSGRELYMYQGDFPDRFAMFPGNFWSRQMMLNEGGLVSAVNDTVGYSKWLLSGSFSSSLPGRAGAIPVKPFANILFNGREHSSFFWEAGFKAGIWDIFEIYVPLVVSENIRFYRNTIKERIRFTLSLEGLFRIRLQ